ncbi:hypothetical protein AAE02nite_08060 [Adhaeribacter aerolatus]|uniref:Outer membrane protein beta-barrel domain-containing protein n=1 Tax=Adhaeribacter aerolatus TaxID=670289 RepID=A0A512ATU5_9BACT|nr:hypothetical protein [Adhaeribacter aerolatus]GEO03142.1 hypothetical protein AAE02nite_08060 [Adhaeribacter aerolatus]
MKFTLTYLFLFLGLCRLVMAQRPAPGPPIGSVFIGLGYTLPTAGFRETYATGHAKGGTFGFTVRPVAGTAPIELGAEVSYLPFGIEKQPVGTGSSSYTLKTTHSQVPLHALVRLKPRRLSTVTPYLDGLAGITVFNSRTKIKEDLFTSLRDEDPIVVSRHTSTVFNYGLAAGFSVAVNNRKSFYADIRLIYLESPLATYVKKGDVLVDQNGDATYLYSRSETSTFMVQLNLLGILKNLAEE